MSWWHRAFPPSPVLRLQVTEPRDGSGWGSEDHVLGSLPWMPNISAHLSTSGYVSPVLRGHSAEQKSGQRRISVTLKASEGGIGWRFSGRWGLWPSQPVSHLMLISSSIFQASGQVTGGADGLSSVLYTGRGSAQRAPSGRHSWTESPLTAAGEEVDERSDVSDRHGQLWQL